MIRVVNYVKTMPWDSSFFYYFYLYQLKLWRTFKELHRESPYDVVDCADHLGEGYGIIGSGIVPTTLRFYTPWAWQSTRSLNYRERWYDIYGIRWLESRSVLNAHCLTCPSRDLSERVTEFFDLRRPVEIIENPIDSEWFSPGEPLSEDTIRVLFLGRLEPRKGPDILVRAIPRICQEVNNIEFCLIGSDCPSLNSASTRAELRSFLDSEGVINRVTFQDPVPLLDLPKWYNSAHIVVVPSRYDNSPYSCLEAMSCGKAVVATEAGGAKEYLDYGKAGLLFPSEDCDALADAVIQLAKDRALREKLGERARQRVRERFDRTVIASRMCLLYERAIEIHGRRQQGDRQI